MKRALIVLALIASPALAGEDVEYITPDIPDEATKRAALLLAYELNGNSMVRHPSLGSIDLSPPPKGLLPKTDRLIPLVREKQK
jgi:hypothetical protein